jgi:hypothetical protein
MKKFLAISLIAMFLLIGMVAADRLPPAVPENQLFSSIEYVNVLGPVMKSVDITSEQSSAYLHNGILFGSADAAGIIANGGNAANPIDPTGAWQGFGEVVSQTTYKNELLTNGGLTDLTYTLGLDTTNQLAESWNLETDEILTYASVDGSTLAATERATLDVAANYEATQNNMRCVFAQALQPVMPAFCNKVTVESTLASVTSMAVQTTLELRDTAASADIAEAMNYKINVDPNAAQGGQYADGQVGVTFTASIREANGWLGDVNGAAAGGNADYYAPASAADWFRNYWDDEARITNYVSSTTVTGGITKLTKQFNYNSQMTF